MVLYQIVCRLSIYNEKSTHPNFRLQFVKLFHVKHSEQWPVRTWVNGVGCELHHAGTGGVGEGLGE